MKEFKGTPGPWTFDDTAVCDKNGNTICIITSLQSTQTQERANARVIAAAPELLEACLMFMDLFTEYDMRPEDECHEVANKMRAAIAKTLGNNQ